MNCFILLILALPSLVAGQYADRTHPATLPVLSDVQRQVLRCSACRSFARELSEVLGAVRQRHHQPFVPHAKKDYSSLQLDLVAIVLDEALCSRLARRYGLLMVNNSVLPLYSRNPSVARASGGWVGPVLEDHCNTLRQQLFSDPEDGNEESVAMAFNLFRTSYNFSAKQLREAVCYSGFTYSNRRLNAADAATGPCQGHERLLAIPNDDEDGGIDQLSAYLADHPELVNKAGIAISEAAAEGGGQRGQSKRRKGGRAPRGRGRKAPENKDARREDER